jgi:hypothetical protein
MKYLYLASTGPGDNDIAAYETAIGAINHILDWGTAKHHRFRVLPPGETIRSHAKTVEANYDHADTMSRWLEEQGYLQFNLCDTRALKVPYYPIE